MKTAIIIPTARADTNKLLGTINSIITETDQEYVLIIVKNDWRGFAHSVNHGIKQALGESTITDIVLLNDDVVVKNGWLQQLLESDCDICGEQKACRGQEGDNIIYVAFWMVKIKRIVFESIGLLDENYKVGEVEDIDFCLRAITCGFKIGITPKEVAEHQAHVSLNKFSEIAKKKGMTDFKYFQDGNRRYFKQKWNGTKWENLLNY